MKKRLLTVALVCAMLVSVSACGGNKQQPVPTAAATTTAATAAATNEIDKINEAAEEAAEEAHDNGQDSGTTLYDDFKGKTCKQIIGQLEDWYNDGLNIAFYVEVTDDNGKTGYKYAYVNNEVFGHNYEWTRKYITDVKGYDIMDHSVVYYTDPPVSNPLSIVDKDNWTVIDAMYDSNSNTVAVVFRKTGGLKDTLLDALDSASGIASDIRNITGR